MLGGNHFVFPVCFCVLDTGTWVPSTFPDYCASAADLATFVKGKARIMNDLFALSEWVSVDKVVSI